MQFKTTGKKTFIKPGTPIDLFLERQLGSSLFTYRSIFAMLLPLVLDQLFINVINLLTMAMISTSSSASISAVSLITPLSMMFFAVFNAISVGGTVIVAQYKGRGDEEGLRIAAGQVMLATSFLAIVSCGILIIGADSLVHSIFASADAVVQQKAIDYLVGMAISLISLSFYMGAFAVFRGIGNTKTCLRLTMLINLIHLFASLLFINVMKLDITGTTLSLNIARLTGGIAAIWLLIRPGNDFHISVGHVFKIDWKKIKLILLIGFPFALEQVFFNGGTMLVQTFIVFLGGESLAANAIATNIFSIFYSAGLAVGTLATTIVGQCIGAGDKDLAKRYGAKIVWLGTAVVSLSILILFPLMPFILFLYNAPGELLPKIYLLMLTAVIPMPLFWSFSNVLPSVMRAAGDSVFNSIISLATMWIVRVGLGFLLAIPLGVGLLGVWLCMGVEWAVRTVIFALRFRSGIWLDKRVID